MKQLNAYVLKESITYLSRGLKRPTGSPTSEAILAKISLTYYILSLMTAQCPWSGGHGGLSTRGTSSSHLWRHFTPCWMKP